MATYTEEYDSAAGVKAKFTGIYDNCYKRPSSEGKTESNFTDCVKSSAETAGNIVCGPPCGVVFSKAAGIVGPILFKIGSALFGNAEEEARLHAQQSAAWDQYIQADAAIYSLHQKALKIANDFPSAVNAMRAEVGDFVLPEYQAATLARLSVARSGSEGYLLRWQDKALPATDYYLQFHNKTKDASVVVSGAWKPIAQQTIALYEWWMNAMHEALVEEAAHIAERMAMKQDFQRAAIDQKEKEKVFWYGIVAAAVIGGGVAYWFARRR